MKARATGNQGNWFARVSAPGIPEVHGKSLPCIWDFWYDGKGAYCDAQYAPTQTKTKAVVEALKTGGLAIMRKRKIGSMDVWESAGYIGIFEVANVRCEEALTFDIVKRVCSLN